MISSGLSELPSSRPGQTLGWPQVRKDAQLLPAAVTGSPVSGRRSPGAWSNSGSPTAPNSTASAARQASRVAVGKGGVTGAKRRASQPDGWLSVKAVARQRSATDSRTCVVAADTTSGPIPSPGSSAIVRVHWTGATGPRYRSDAETRH